MQTSSSSRRHLRYCRECGKDQVGREVMAFSKLMAQELGSAVAIGQPRLEQ